MKFNTDATLTHEEEEDMEVVLKNRKYFGQVFTPNEVARTLVRWVVRQQDDRLLDPACGDGRFIACHSFSTGVELDSNSVILAKQRSPHALVYEGDFFTWAGETPNRFEAACGNPPFIRYQLFSGLLRERALKEAAKLGARFSRLTSSWAPFLIVAARLLKPGGRMAFVVPAEIGHAPYAIPVIETLCRNFSQVRVIAIREKIFPELSEDAWILYADDFGGSTSTIEISTLEQFDSQLCLPRIYKLVDLNEWRQAGYRLRKFLLSDSLLGLYEDLASRQGVVELGGVAQAGIGYVSGANDFFHLRPSDVVRERIPAHILRVSIRKAAQLPSVTVDSEVVRSWINRDEAVLLLDLNGIPDPPLEIRKYLNSERGKEVRVGYKCRNRDPWFAVPDIRVPDAFLSYMSGERPLLVRNEAGCVCTNSVHAVFLKRGNTIRHLQQVWAHPFVDLSCELEGHPLGGGMLKLEPREASKVKLPMKGLTLNASDSTRLFEATAEMRRWRHYA